eukprot:9068437-Pyramimonas_sp.AAC.1
MAVPPADPCRISLCQRLQCCAPEPRESDTLCTHWPQAGSGVTSFSLTGSPFLPCPRAGTPRTATVSQ